MGALVLVIIGVVVLIAVLGIVLSAVKSKKANKIESELIAKIEEGDTSAINTLTEHYKSCYLGKDPDIEKMIKIHLESVERNMHYRAAVEKAIEAFPTYLTILDIRKALTQAGYKAGDFSYFSTSDYVTQINYKDVTFLVSDSADKILGNIKFSKHLFLIDKAGKDFEYHHKPDPEHMICLKGIAIVIKSSTPYTEPPPKWMIICANILANAYEELSIPDWEHIDDFKNVKKYLNVAFN